MEKPVEIKTAVVTVSVGGKTIFQTYNDKAVHHRNAEHLLMAKYAISRASDKLAKTLEWEGIHLTSDVINSSGEGIQNPAQVSDH